MNVVTRRASVVVLTGVALAVRLWLTRRKHPLEAEQVLMSTVGRNPYTPLGEW